MINLSTLSMHRLLKDENQTGLFEKFVMHSDMDSENIKLLFVTKSTNIIENVMPANFIQQIKEIIIGEEEPELVEAESISALN